MADPAKAFLSLSETKTDDRERTRKTNEINNKITNCDSDNTYCTTEKEQCVVDKPSTSRASATNCSTKTKMTKNKKRTAPTVASRDETTKKGKEEKDDDLSIIKEQLKELSKLIPVVTELKSAYDNFNGVDNNDEEVDLGGTETETEINQFAEREVERMTQVDSGASEDVSSMSYFKDITGTNVSLGPIINEDIANGIANILEKGIDNGTKDRLYNKYEVPQNCDRLKVIECNAEIHKRVSNDTRVKDGHLLKVQTGIMKGLSATISAFDILNKQENQNENTRNAINCLSDSLALIANSSHQLDVCRRYMFKGDLRDEFSQLCSGSYPVSGLLFGEKLPEKIKDVCEIQKMSQRLTKTRMHPYNNVNRSGKRFPFLGQRNTTWKKGWNMSSYTRKQGNYNYQSPSNQNYNQSFNQKRSKGNKK